MAALERAFGLPSLAPRLPRLSGLLEDSWGATLAAGWPQPGAQPAGWPAGAGGVLALDVQDTGATLELAADVPGFAKDDLRVEVSGVGAVLRGGAVSGWVGGPWPAPGTLPLLSQPRRTTNPQRTHPSTPPALLRRCPPTAC